MDENVQVVLLIVFKAVQFFIGKDNYKNYLQPLYDAPPLEGWSTANMYNIPGSSLFTPSAILNAPYLRYPRIPKYFPYYAMDESCLYQVITALLL